ncbi:transglycosylase SLT domain-containing protein [Acetobacter sp. AN02]|uniref:transglycosylase SLT domain-containing protein n=1 Tax=Acetobacter sp. AN02 TaxID=2894186 RepID=UPI0038D1E207
MSARLRNVLLLAGLAGFLAACAAEQQEPDLQVTVAQEEARYRAHAKSYYAPPGPEDDPWGPYITEASKRYDVPDAWIRAVINRESGGRMFYKGQLVTSAPGAMGLMQLMPPTYDTLRVANNLGDDPYEPHDNIMAGTAYIREMYDIYGSPGFLAAYNAGPGRLEDFLTRNRTLPRETRNYVSAIGREIAGINPVNRSPADLLVEAHTSGSGAAYAAAAPSAGQTNAVRAAWEQREGDTDSSADTGSGSAPVSVRDAWAQKEAGTTGSDNAAQGTPEEPVQVAEAPQAETTERTDDTSGTEASPAAQPSVAAQPPVQSWEQAQKTPAAPEAVSAVWAARTGVAAAPAETAAAPAQVVAQQAAPAQTSAPQPPVQTSEAALSALTPVKPKPARQQPARVITPAHVLTPVVTKDWGIQVGAFASTAQASGAVARARSGAGGALSGARQQVSPVTTAHGQFYRARLTGITRDSAIAACQRLERRPGNCIVVSPDSA